MRTPSCSPGTLYIRSGNGKHWAVHTECHVKDVEDAEVFMGNDTLYSEMCAEDTWGTPVESMEDTELFTCNTMWRFRKIPKCSRETPCIWWEVWTSPRGSRGIPWNVTECERLQASHVEHLQREGRGRRRQGVHVESSMKSRTPMWLYWTHRAGTLRGLRLTRGKYSPVLHLLWTSCGHVSYTNNLMLTFGLQIRSLSQNIFFVCFCFCFAHSQIGSLCCWFGQWPFSEQSLTCTGSLQGLCCLHFSIFFTLTV